MIVRLTPTAARQLAGILAYLDERNPQGSRRVAVRMQAIIGLLSAFPQLGEETNRPGQRRAILGPYPYAVFYRVRGDEVLIQRIRHTARRLD